ncbi:hypothetical protein [Syntrophomonas wolfei]|nr:hypothetical protein [Syntrophomonas wolfei]
MSQRLLDRQPFARTFPGGNSVLMGYIKKDNLISGLLVAFFTFFIALLVSLGSEALVRAVNNVIVALILLLMVILLGIFFDIIGTAATAAQMPPFNARAAKKIFGAKQAVKLVGNAHLVANFCNDVIGDIAGTLSGAIGAGIVISLVNELVFLDIILAGALMTSFIAALTVGGKAVGKSLAVNQANSIIFRVAIILAWWEKMSGMELFKNRR